jgi:hypothetical protein
MVIFQLDVVHNWLNKLSQKSMDEKLSPSVCPSKGVVIHMVLAALTPKAQGYLSGKMVKTTPC